MTKKERALRQIKISKPLISSIRRYCNEQSLSLTQFYDQMIWWYFNEFDFKKDICFHASQQRGERLSLWIQKSDILKIQNIAIRHNISDARVIHTALINYVNLGITFIN